MTAPPQPEAWYALRHMSNRALSIREALHADCVEDFLPTYTVETRWTDRTRLTKRPLFPGYIFARFDPAQAAQILRIPGVIQILSIGLRPAPIEDEVIAALRRIHNGKMPAAVCAFVAGQTVTIERGPFAGVCGVISRTCGATKLTIPMEIFGRSVAVDIDAADAREVAK